LGTGTPVVKKKLPLRSLTHILINNHQRAYLFIAAGKVAWGRLGKAISLNSGFALEIASLNFDSFNHREHTLLPNRKRVNKEMT